MGPPGSGKSDLALRLIDGGAELVADDRVAVTVRDGTPVASAPAALAGLIEVRGLGVLRLDYRAEAPIRLAADMADRSPVDRLPEEEAWNEVGVPVKLVRLVPWEASAAAKVRLALSVAVGHIGTVR